MAVESPCASVITIAPWRRPVAAGVKAMLRLQLAPAASTEVHDEFCTVKSGVIAPCAITEPVGTVKRVTCVPDKFTSVNVTAGEIPPTGRLQNRKWLVMPHACELPAPGAEIARLLPADPAR